jgi:hypothetical protein
MPVKLQNGKSLSPRAGFNPKTAARPAMQPRTPVRSSPETSSDTERQIRQPAQPFANPQGTVNLPAPTHPGFRSTGGPKELVDKFKDVGCKDTSTTDEMMAAVGYSPSATKSTNPIISGYPTRNNQRRTGPDQQPRRGRK